MGIVTEHYLESWMEKTDGVWRDSSFRDTFNSLYGFEYEIGDQVEVEDEDDPYEIVDHFTLISIGKQKEVYLGDRLSEDPDGVRRRSYNQRPIREEEIQ